jgi:hypothetical protein
VPKKACVQNVTLLPFLCPARQQDHKRIAIPAEIDPIPRTEVDPEFENPLANTFDIGVIARRDALQRGGNFGGCKNLKILHPVGEGRFAIIVHVIADFGHEPR